MEADTPPVMRIGRTSSIENEPRTLSDYQMQYAREAAQNVVNTRSPEDALSIFTAGLAPVSDSPAVKASSVLDEEEEKDDCFGRRQRWFVRDVVTAPF